MNDSLRSIIRLVVVAALLAGGARAMYRRAHPKPEPTRLRGSPYPGDAPVAVVHDTGSAARNVNNPNGFADEEYGRQRAREDSIFRAANGEGLTTKQTYVAPLYPETTHYHPR